MISIPYVTSWWHIDITATVFFYCPSVTNELERTVIASAKLCLLIKMRGKLYEIHCSW